MKIDPKAIKTNQVEPHDELHAIVSKYRSSVFNKPIAEHTARAFESVLEWLTEWEGEVIIDACCGVGESTSWLAKRHPDCKIIGVDKSAARLSKHQYYDDKIIAKSSICTTLDVSSNIPNHIVVQADLTDFWRLLENCLRAQKWTIKKQFLLYPNPYPKKSQVQKRWHASPTFKSILACNQVLEVRSNWLIYLQEFHQALAFYNIQSKICTVSGEPITPFERKYLASGQPCWILTTSSV